MFNNRLSQVPTIESNNLNIYVYKTVPIGHVNDLVLKFFFFIFSFS